MAKLGPLIHCPYCPTVFRHNLRPELQECPKCHSKLICTTPITDKAQQK